MLLEGPHGFARAPVLRLIFCLSALSSIFIPSIIKRNQYLALSSNFMQLYTPITAHLVFFSPQELIYGLPFLYAFREFERRLGSNKFLVSHFLFSYLLLIYLFRKSFLLMIILLSSIFQLSLLHLFPSLTSMSSGPYALLFGFLPNLIFDIPSPTMCHLFGTPLSYKTFLYLLLLQMTFAAYPASSLTALSALIAGFLVQTRVLPLHRLRLPKSLCRWMGIDGGSVSTPTSMRQMVSADSDAVSALVSLGFEEAAARRALIRSNNDLSAASNLLLDQRRQQ